MKITTFTMFSDHKPLELSLNITAHKTKVIKPLKDSYAFAPRRYKTSLVSKDNFKESMKKQSSKGINILNSTYLESAEGTYSLNSDLTKYLQDIANDSLTLTSTKTASYTNNQPWFTKDNRDGKINLRKAACIVSQFPDNEYLRKNFYKVKGHYKSLNKGKKDNFFDRINAEIEGGKILNWSQFKKLKNYKSKTTVFDSADMDNFEKFFSKLYANEHQTMSKETKANLLAKAIQTSDQKYISDANQANILNDPFTSEEITATISGLKNGKSSSDDLISNEILKYLVEDENGTNLLKKLFNQCLDTATYPWNNSIISPLHKKGCKSDPDNYRAVAVSSTLGKLFSTILLNRILKIKSDICPDPINQLGFSKGAQTCDHILTLSTIASKYRKLKQPVYAVFVDFRKAFDSVCREALFHKLANQGISGKVFNTLKHMYTNSTGQIKISGHLSNKFNISKGTEQGHPLSPDFFKMYINDLSPLLEHENCPKLINQIVSHLLWADDLILLALDPITIQKQLDSLDHFCKEWGVDINMTKTKLIVFNPNPNHAVPTSLKICGKPVAQVESYCYLGIEIHKSGKYTLARNELTKKAVRSLYSLKSTVNKTRISFRSLTTLFDSLVKPIALYGAPIWTATMPIIKTMAKLFHAEQTASNSSILKKFSYSNCEKLHLHFLKWALGVNRKASNAGAWGESGRYPLIMECINLTLKYFRRIKSLKNDSLISLAYQEQKLLNLEWYKGIESILTIDPCFTADHVSSFKQTKNKNHTHCTNSHPQFPDGVQQNCFMFYRGTKIMLPEQKLSPAHSERYSLSIINKSLKSKFRNLWESNIKTSSKLSFYQQVKSSFAKESYLDLITNSKDRFNLSRLRISAHHLEIERGRYKKIPQENRTCAWCKLCLGQDIVENENHLLNQCDLYASNRQITSQKISNQMKQGEHIHSNNIPNPSHSFIYNTSISLIYPYQHPED